MKRSFPATSLSHLALCLLLGLAAGASPGARAQVPGAAAAVPPSAEYIAAHTRWKGSLDAFANADKERLPGNDGVLFVGSSTIRLWTNLAQDFRQVPVVINRGFGGSTLADCSLFARELVVRYKPKHVLVYAGDNDLAEGHSPLQVLESFARLVNTVRAELPDVRISYISIKPSPSRQALLPKMREANNAIAAYVQRLPNSAFVDIFTPMLGADGQPRPELFLGDRLHLNEQGYRLWQSILLAHLPATESQPAAPVISVARPVDAAAAVARLPVGAATPAEPALPPGVQAAPTSPPAPVSPPAARR
ncbi:MAG: GDSL family lipase [Variovorax sp.]|nr:MAG: GDSL family lipase [Variovorax sp.]